MHKTIFRLALAVLMFFPVSCSDDYLDTENKNALTDGSFYQTREDFQQALNTCYTPLAGGGMYGLRMQFLQGSFSDRLLHENTNLDRVSFSPSDGTVNQPWTDLYYGFYRTNVFIREIQNAEDVEGIDESRLNFEAQARALRAAYAFYLVTIFNEPVFYDENSIPSELGKNLTNGEAEQFWDLIEEDLKFASTEDDDYLPLEYSDEDVGRITRGAARSLLGKAMLYKHYYYYANPLHEGQKGSDENIEELRLAKQSFEDVMESGVYGLIEPKEPKTEEDYLYALLSNSSYVDLPAGDNLYKSENNQESIWEVQYSDERFQNGWIPGGQWTGELNYQYFSPHRNSYRNHEGHPDLWEEFEEVENHEGGFEKDPRAYATFYLDGDRLDFRPENSYYNTTYVSGIHNRRMALNRDLLSMGEYPTNGFGVKKYYFPQYTDKASPSNAPYNRRVIRYADVLLMYAEVTLLLGEDTDRGLDALNEVRDRVDMPEVNNLTREAIIHERDVELAFESLRWFDLIRWSFDSDWGIDMQEMLSRQIRPDGTGDFFKKGKHEYFPIPVNEIDISEGELEQNPGW